MRNFSLISAVAASVTGLLSLTVPVSGGEKDAPTDRYLIVHADDAGMSHSVNRATIDALESGIVNSASIMVPCAWFKEFAEYAKENPQYDYGIHLTLTSEWKYYRWGPVTDRGKVPSLVDPEGYLWGTVPEVVANVRAEDADRELRAQIDRALEFGVPLSHLDTHMGAVLGRADLVEVYGRLAIDYNLPILFVRDPDGRLAEAYPAVAEQGPAIAKELDAKGLPQLDAVLQFYDSNSHEQRLKTYHQALSNLPPGVTQMIIHCGYADEELTGITSSVNLRDSDRRVFSSEDTRQLLKDQGVKLISWKELHQKTLNAASE